MAIATFHQWLTFYDETLKSVFPKQNPRVVLAGLRFLQHSPATEKELIQRTGLRQSRINLLLKRLRELGLVERVTVRKDRTQENRLTTEGQQIVAKLDAALAKMAAKTAAVQPGSAQTAPIPGKVHDNPIPAASEAADSAQSESEEVRHQKRFAKNFGLDKKRQA